MSIIVSVYLKEGIVMSADSRLTGITPCKDGVRDQYTVSDNGQKLFLIKNGNIGISSCGDQTLDGKTIADFIRCFELEEVRSEDTVSDVANKLAAYVKGKHAGIVIFHVCGYVNSERFVYRIIDSDEQHDITSEIDVPGQCAAVWNGEPKVIANLLTGEHAIPIEWHCMQLKDGIDFAEFLVDVTCKIHRFQTGIGTCGGPIDTLLITKDYSKWIKHKILAP